MFERHRPSLRVATIVMGILVVTLSQGDSATVQAKSVALSDVVSAIRSASEGDTVVVPAGTASWTSTLSIKKGITLQGAGNDKTIILDDVPRTRQNKGGGLMDIRLTPSQSFRLTGFTFRYGSVAAPAQHGGVRLGGTCPSVRIDHCHFDRTYQIKQIHTYGQIYGVIDHCVFDSRSHGGTLAILVWHDKWGGKFYGDGSWADAPYWGSEKFLFIEDNTFNNLGGRQTNGNIDAKNGARYVARYNNFNNCMPNSHGTEGGPNTGVRAMEIYNNHFHWTFQSSGGQIRSGTALIHDNTWEGVRPTHVMVLQQYRIFRNDPPLGPSSGRNGWDLNDTEGNGTNVPGHSPFVYTSGIASTSAVGSLTVSPSPNWKINQWVNYEVTNLDQQKKPGYPVSSYIKSNTSDTIKFASSGSVKSVDMAFTAGNRFQIYKLLVSVDQPGRGKRDLIRNSRGLTGSPRWSNQVSEPVYAWNNNYVDKNKVSSPLFVHSIGPTIQENRDFYNNTPMPGYQPYTYPHPLVKGAPAPAVSTTESRSPNTHAGSPPKN
jgi:hypothetical protein